jgi:ribonuclease HII
MVEYAQLHRGYGFERHKGYGTADRIQALGRLGPLMLHPHLVWIAGGVQMQLAPWGGKP